MRLFPATCSRQACHARRASQHPNCPGSGRVPGRSTKNRCPGRPSDKWTERRGLTSYRLGRRRHRPRHKTRRRIGLTNYPLGRQHRRPRRRKTGLTSCHLGSNLKRWHRRRHQHRHLPILALGSPRRLRLLTQGRPRTRRPRRKLRRPGGISCRPGVSLAASSNPLNH